MSGGQGEVSGGLEMSEGLQVVSKCQKEAPEAHAEPQTGCRLKQEHLLPKVVAWLRPEGGSDIAPPTPTEEVACDFLFCRVMELRTW